MFEQFIFYQILTKLDYEYSQNLAFPKAELMSSAQVFHVFCEGELEMYNKFWAIFYIDEYYISIFLQKLKT